MSVCREFPLRANNAGANCHSDCAANGFTKDSAVLFRPTEVPLVELLEGSEDMSSVEVQALGRQACRHQLRRLRVVFLGEAPESVVSRTDNDRFIELG